MRGNDIVEKSPLANKRGRIPVDPQLRSFEYPEIFVVGDCAFATSKDVIHAPTAQLSAQMGDYVGRYLANLVLGKANKKDFHFVHRGTICSIGHTDGVGVVYSKRLKGEMAAFMKNTIENRWLFSIGGLSMVFRKGQFRYRTSS
ncbi:NADH dehydrogenase Ndh [Helicobacter fennelliae]|uniref:NADH dehydrogenase Ndh n=1 Tax=Helicobacter fennelliae TaxID=215 RepID=A0A2X3B8Q2_9HELI|nr:NADH dehydrogenase Ndh [Helicobacter fennelliae]